MIAIYLLGKKVWSKQVGLLATLIYCLSVFPIQAAHFYAVDTLLALFALLTLYRLIIFYDQPSLKNAFFSGLLLGFSLATKISSVLLIATIGVTLIVDLLLVFLKKFRKIWIAPKFYKEFISFLRWVALGFLINKKKKTLKTLSFIFFYGVFILVVGFLTFALAEPYALIDFPNFRKQILEQQQMTRSAYVFPYTLQYVDTTAYLYQIKNLVLWGLGLPLGVFSLVSVIWLSLRLLLQIPKLGNKNQESKKIILFSFFIVYFAVVGKFAVKFMRYLLPIYGLLALFTASFFISLINSSGRKKCGLFPNGHD
jgi:4-amino-4-deoxy-L-arabinose transferase-like glycosyltransferase